MPLEARLHETVTAVAVDLRVPLAELL